MTDLLNASRPAHAKAPSPCRALAALIGGLSVCLIAYPSMAQDEPVPADTPDYAESDNPARAEDDGGQGNGADESGSAGGTQSGEAEPDADDDNSANDLNARQQLRQTFTLERRINGAVVEREQRDIVYDDNDPLRASEAGQSPLEQLRAKFDGQALTRNEAFEEAKIDFALADADRNGLMTRAEFIRLVGVWNDDAGDRDAGDPDTGDPDAGAPTTPEPAAPSARSAAAAKFAFMAGAANGIDRATYIREFLLDFDTSDTDDDGVLSDEALARFRAVVRGFDVTDIGDAPLLEPAGPDVTLITPEQTQLENF